LNFFQNCFCVPKGQNTPTIIVVSTTIIVSEFIFANFLVYSYLALKNQMVAQLRRVGVPRIYLSELGELTPTLGNNNYESTWELENYSGVTREEPERDG
jgi:hypothetical protein